MTDPLRDLEYLREMYRRQTGDTERALIKRRIQELEEALSQTISESQRSGAITPGPEPDTSEPLLWGQDRLRRFGL